MQSPLACKFVSLPPRFGDGSSSSSSSDSRASQWSGALCAQLLAHSSCMRSHRRRLDVDRHHHTRRVCTSFGTRNTKQSVDCDKLSIVRARQTIACDARAALCRRWCPCIVRARFVWKGDGEKKNWIKIDSVRFCRRARVRADRRRALTAIPEVGQFVLSARFVMPAVVLPTRHCVAVTNTSTPTSPPLLLTTKSPSVAAVTIAAAAAATAAAAAATVSVNTTTTTFYWLPVVDSPACYNCCYCGGRLLVVGGVTTTGTNVNSSIGSSSSNSSINCFDACSPPSLRNFGRLCRCDGAVAAAATAAVVLLVPYVLGPPCFRPFVLPPAFVAAASHLRYHRRIHNHHLYNSIVAGNSMETR